MTLITCQCGKRSDKPCSRVATQEDFLCDVCRKGCATLTILPFQGQPGEIRGHMEIRSWDELERARGAAGVRGDAAAGPAQARHGITGEHLGTHWWRP